MGDMALAVRGSDFPADKDFSTFIVMRICTVVRSEYREYRRLGERDKGVGIVRVWFCGSDRRCIWWTSANKPDM